MNLSNPSLRRTLLGVLSVPVGVAILSGAAYAHEWHGAEADGEGVALAVVVGLSVVVGLGSGAAVLLADSPRRTNVSTMLGRAIGPLLVVLGLTYASSAAIENSVLSVAGLVCGVVAGWLVSTRAGCRCADATFGAVVVHRTVEGGALAVASLAEPAVGVLGAVVLAGHTAVETVAVSGLYAPRRRLRAMVAIALLQVGFLVGAGAGLLTAAALPGTVRTAVPAIGGGVLLVVGAMEMVAHRRSGSGYGVEPSV